jgi:hypothetical protein
MTNFIARIYMEYLKTGSDAIIQMQKIQSNKEFINNENKINE